MNKASIKYVTVFLGTISAGMVCAGDMGSLTPKSNWSGFYAGGVVGGVWGNNDFTWNPLPSALEFGAATIASNRDSSSVMGGILAGYNYQFKPTWLAGVEGEWIWANLKDTLYSAPWLNPASNSITAPNSFTSSSSDVNWIPSIRGRLGFLVKPNLMLFGAAGISWANIDYVANNNNGFIGNAAYATNASFSKTSVGYTLGGGIEWATVYNLLVRAEYLYYQFNSAQNVIGQDLTGDYPTYPSNYVWGKTSVNAFRVGLAYQFSKV